LTSPTLSIEGLSKRYGETLAVNNVSLSVDGEIFGLLGANGAGKSTLIKAVLGLVRPDAGAVAVAGINPAREPVEAKSKIGYLPEELILYERLTGREFLEFVAGIKGIDDTSQIDSDLAYFALTDKADDLIREYSLGMRKKISIIAAWLGNPPLLLLDEPLNGLDAESMRLVRLRLEQLRAGGSTIVLSSHVMSFVERVCERCVILRKGSIVAEGSPTEIRIAAGMADDPFEDVFLSLALGP
jgi:ABC-2 type transport system ATP-binding protein